MKKVSIITAEEAALKVQDGDTIATGGFVSCACPETLSKALEKRFLETGHPQNLTLFFAAGQGHRDGTGGDHYGHEGMVKRVIGGHWDRAPKLGEFHSELRMSRNAASPLRNAVLAAFAQREFEAADSSEKSRAGTDTDSSTDAGTDARVVQLRATDTQPINTDQTAGAR